MIKAPCLRSSASALALQRHRPPATSNAKAVASLAFFAIAIGLVPLSTAFVLPVAHRHGRRRFATPYNGAAAAVATVSEQESEAVIYGSDDPALEIIDPTTNVTVVLVGCLHGSRSSSSDVQRAIEDGPTTDAVVLELCAARFADVRNEVRSRSASSALLGGEEEMSDYLDGSESGFGGMRGWAAGVPLFLGAVRRTAEKRGMAAAVAALALGTVSGTQAALSGFEPGREFRVALECVVEGRAGCRDGGRGKGVGEAADIILADKTVDETLRRVGNLPAVSGGMMHAFLSRGDWNEEGAYGAEVRALSTAIWGDPKLVKVEGLPRQVDMGRCLIRNSAVRMDLARLTVPPLLLAEGLASAVNKGLDALMGQGGVGNDANIGAAFVDLSSSLTLTDVISISSGIVMDAATSAAVLALGYILLALPIVKLIISERDESLAKGVRQACRLAAAKRRRRDDSTDEGGRVVAVLGLLHVNGVAQRLVEENERS